MRGVVCGGDMGWGGRFFVGYQNAAGWTAEGEVELWFDRNEWGMSGDMLDGLEPEQHDLIHNYAGLLMMKFVVDMEETGRTSFDKEQTAARMKELLDDLRDVGIADN